jgi:hypothetical protein
MHCSNGTTDGGRQWQAVITPTSKSTMMHCPTERAMFGEGLGEKDGEWLGTVSLKSESEHNIEGCGAAWQLNAPCIT